MPLSTLLIVGGSWVLLLVLAIWKYTTWKNDGGDES